ncbi:MAG TPA: hypothetical protein VFG43_08425 [Geminicoccaceae bacterium]|nr:hypothetical protein [Geminicoccaceae bacterium]
MKYVALTGSTALLFAAGMVLAPSDARADEAALIEEALSAAPPQVAETATVRDLEGNVLREGTGAYTCFPAPPALAGPMCMDEPWLAWMDAWMHRQPFTPSAVGFAYMLAGDTPGGGASNIDPFATEPTADNDWVVEGPHVMIIAPDEALFAGLPTDPHLGGPYVMWAGTPYVHVMWPVDERPEQRRVAAAD